MKPTKRELQAYEMMTQPVETVRALDSIRVVVQLFSEKNIGAAAVEDQSGQAVGVITKTDVVRYEEQTHGNHTEERNVAIREKGESARPGFHLLADEEPVQNWMTPVIFSVKPETPLKEIAQRMVRYGVHHIFVQTKPGDPILGIVSSFDVLRHVAAFPKELKPV